MNTHDYKINLIKALKNRDIFTEQVSGIQIRTRCPYCGDSTKNYRTGHLYLRINPDDELPIVYNCFKCPASGILTYKDLELLGIEGIEFKDGLKSINKNSTKYSKNDYNKKEIFFQYKLPTNYDERKISYLENRLGRKFNDNELLDMKVITSFKDFLLLNDINKITCKPGMARFVEKKYIGFLSNNSAYILFRDITDTSEIRWYKYPITTESIGQKIFYSISSNIDLYSQDDIIINLSEGVMDAISIAYNLGYHNPDNILNIAVCGKFYNSVIEYLLCMGLIGSNIIINIFADRDYTRDTSIKYYRDNLTKYSYLVKELNIFYNTKEKDCGVRKEDIVLKSFKL